MPGPVRIILIGGAGRSGSTLVDVLLGAAPGAVAVGESMTVWTHGVLRNHGCSCGQRFHDCPFWTAVGREGFGGWDRGTAKQLKFAQKDNEAPGRVIRARLRGERRTPKSAALSTARAMLYRAIATVSGSQVVVDSSKLPYFGYQVSLLPGFETRVVHVIRDPRATAFSWLRPTLGIQRPQVSAARWMALNAGTEAAWLFRGRRLRVKYEDLATSPARGVARLLRFAGLPPTPLSDLLRDHEHHLVRGNPMGYRPGVRSIQLDDEWQGEMTAAQKWAVTWRTLPLLAAYGYRPWSGFV